MKKLNRYMLNERVEEIRLKTIKANQDYIKQSTSQKQLFQQIQALLPEENKYMLVKLDDCFSYQSAIIERIMYEYGIRDCINFLIHS